MPLTPAQQAAIKADILVNSDLNSQPNSPDGAFEIARLYNLAAAGTWIVWRGAMPVSDIEQNGFAWNQLDSVPAAKYRIWERLTATGAINPSKANVRQGINDFARDASNAVLTALKDSIYPHLKRQATRIEKVLSTGTGSDATPATMGFEGPVSYADIDAARNS